MGKRCLVFALILMILAGFSACSNFQDKANSEAKNDSQDKKTETKMVDVYTVAENFCVKDGENYKDRTILTNTDFVGFTYNFSESEKEVFIYLELTSEGQKKMDEATKKFTQVPGFLSVWIGDELICTKKMWSHITNDEFVVSVPNINENDLEAFIDKTKGKPNSSPATQDKPQEILPDIDYWNKEVISDKPEKIQIKYTIIRQDGSKLTVLDLKNNTEEYDLDNDGHNEIVEYIQGDKRNIVIYDVVDGALNSIDVSNKLGATWSEYMGNMGNIAIKYSNCIEVGFEDFNKDIHYDVYKYENGTLTYLCPFYDALGV